MITTGNHCVYYKYSVLSSFEKAIYYEKIDRFLNQLAWEYPGFQQWYGALFHTNKELVCGREIIICEMGLSIAGIAILKSNEWEKKICTLRVAKPFQKQGIGRRLVECSFEWLQDDRPMITINKRKQHQFQPLFDYYGFSLEQKKWNYYRIFGTELVYNGLLPERKVLFPKMKLLDIQVLYDKFRRCGGYDFNKFLENCIKNWCEKEGCLRKGRFYFSAADIFG